MKTKIDIERCRKAMRNISVEGRPRTHLIAEAIAEIQRNPKSFSSGYFGIKNYAGFGDQREDHQYGMGPRHGSIVFSIGRTDRDSTVKLGADEIYLLECVRDFGYIEEPGEYSYQTRQLNLCAVIRRLSRHQKAADEYLEKINSKVVDSILLDFESLKEPGEK